MTDVQIPDFSAGPALHVVAMPKDTNPAGDIFGGWLLSLIDLAGSRLAIETAQGRVATVGMEAIKFLAPVQVGDEVSCFTTLRRIGRTSITVHVEAWVRRWPDAQPQRVTEAVVSYVALDAAGRKRMVPREIASA